MYRSSLELHSLTPLLSRRVGRIVAIARPHKPARPLFLLWVATAINKYGVQDDATTCRRRKQNKTTKQIVVCVRLECSLRELVGVSSANPLSACVPPTEKLPAGAKALFIVPLEATVPTVRREKMDRGRKLAANRPLTLSW